MSNPLPAPQTVAAAIAADDFGTAIALATSETDGGAPSVDALIEVADALVQRGRHSAAVQLLEPYADRLGDQPHFCWLLGLALSNCYKHGQAEKFLRVAAESAPGQAQIQYMTGRNLFKAGRNEEALPYLQRAVAAAPEMSDANFLLSLTYVGVGNFDAALPVMRKAAALDPTNQTIALQLRDVEGAADAKPPKTVFARWPRTASEFFDLKAVIRSHIQKGFDTRGIRISTGSRVFTQGSCFAGNLARSLQRYDLKVSHLPCGEEQNNTYANVVVLDWLKNGAHDENTSIVEENIGRENRAQYIAAIKSADVFIYTMGVAAMHFDRLNGEFVMARNTNASKAALFKRAAFLTSTVAENAKNLNRIIADVRSFSPRAAIVLTVSPVPMNMTTEMNSAIVSDCLSKSTLRVAVEEVLRQELDNVVYWPSFEIIRWIGGHIGPVYGVDDGSGHHVNFEMINHAVDGFLETFGDSDLRASATVPAPVH